MGGGWFLDTFAKRLNRGASSVLLYVFHDDILTSDPETTRQSFEHLSDEIATDLSSIRNDFDRIKFVGFSLGNVALALTTSKFQDFDSVSEVLTASSFAESAWDGIRTRHLRRDMESDDLTLAELRDIWQNLEPANHIGELAGKQVKIVVSDNDRVIPTRLQQQYVSKLDKSGINYESRTARTGHYATIAIECLFGNQ
jgi:predicted esterase